ncbi:MAG: NADH-quinone oxidoreductase subunit NuoG [Fimbriimonadaceae bacterium]|nr:NADH-quinone oxidoreductase subunit NuoG [Fimbriimonadaceae bacterium]
MAAVASTDTVTILVNDVELQVPKGEIIVESVKRLGLEIPIFCYHSRMKPVGMCRMCLVEVGFKQPDGSVRKMPKPQAACTLPASDGMAIYTDTEMVHRDRKSVLELLLINHPLDCPICDRGGECPLQNNTLIYGPSTSRYIEIKRHLPKAYPLSSYVTLDLERCIQCGRCVRFTEEISGDSQLAFRFRGASMQPSTFELRNFESKFSGNVIEICPVGALTNAEYRFRARPWDLETRPAICTLCSNGCNVWFDYRAGKMVRMNGRTNEAVNEEWTCDKGKFGHEFYNDEKRLKNVLVRRGEKLIESEWATAYADLIPRFEKAGKKAAVLMGGSLSNEAYYMVQKLVRNGFKCNNLDHRWTKHLMGANDRLETKMNFKSVQTQIASFENKSAVLIFGTSLADEQPILFLRVRKAWFQNGAKVVVAHDSPTDADSFAHLILRYKPGTEEALANAILAATVESGKASVPDAVKKQLVDFSPEKAEKITGVPAAQIREAASLMGPGAAIITTHSLLNVDKAQDTLEAVAAVGMTTGAEFNCYALNANDIGADAVGILPDGKAAGKDEGLNTHDILQDCANGKIESLWLMGCDPFTLHPDRHLVERALESVEFLVVQDIAETEALSYASVVLPMCAPAEDDGTYTNMEGRVQRLKPVLDAKGNAKSAWRIAQEVILRITPGAPIFNPKDVMAEMAGKLPAFANATYDRLEGEGVVLSEA